MTAQLSHKGTQARTTEPVTATSRGRLVAASHRIHLAIQEMNHASRRMVELQAPWNVDSQWHRR